MPKELILTPQGLEELKAKIQHLSTERRREVADRIRDAFDRTGAAAVLLARGSLGNPWRFERLLGRRDGDPRPDEVAAELR